MNAPKGSVDFVAQVVVSVSVTITDYQSNIDDGYDYTQDARDSVQSIIDKVIADNRSVSDAEIVEIMEV